MAGYVRFALEDGAEVFFESAEEDLVAQHAGEPQVAEGGPLAGRMRSLAAAAEEVSKGLRSRLDPDEITLEFGVKVSGDVNWWFFAKNHGEAAINVTLKWSNPAARH